MAGSDYDCPVTARLGLGVDTDTDQTDLTWDWDGTTDNLHGSLHTLVSRGEQRLPTSGGGRFQHFNPP